MNNQPEQQPIQQETTTLLQGNRELAVLYSIAGYLNHKVDVHEALQEVLAHVTELLGLRTSWIWLLDEQGEPRLAAALALPPYLADHPIRMTGYCLCLDKFLDGALEGAANIDVYRCSRLQNAERESDPSSLGLRFHASVPIYAGNIPLGVLNVASEDWRELKPEELQLLHIISDQIGLAVQRARISAEHTQAAAHLATTEERNRLAREIHDTLAQGLAAITLQLETADALAETRPARAHEAIQRALTLARSNLEEARRSVMDLRAAPLLGRTLPAALAALTSHERNEGQSRNACNECSDPHEDRADHADTAIISYTYTPVLHYPVLSAHIESGLYRVAQEAIANAQKHAHAQHIEVMLSADEQQVQLIVQDDGIGFDPALVAHRSEGHFGLAGMSERVKLLGGTLSIQSTPGTGTRIAVTVPRKP